jgi:hypothetical protein
MKKSKSKEKIKVIPVRIIKKPMKAQRVIVTVAKRNPEEVKPIRTLVRIIKKPMKAQRVTVTVTKPKQKRKKK